MFLSLRARIFNLWLFSMLTVPDADGVVITLKLALLVTFVTLFAFAKGKY